MAASEGVFSPRPPNFPAVIRKAPPESLTPGARNSRNLRLSRASRMREVGGGGFLAIARRIISVPMIRFRTLLLGLILGLGALGGSAVAQNGALPDAAPKVKASLVPEHPAIAPGATVTVAMREEIRKDWHT